MSLKTHSLSVKTSGGLLVMREVARKHKEKIWERIEEMEANHVLKLDFKNIKFIDVSCADELVVRILARLEAGELVDRYIILSQVRNQHRENIDTALKVAKKTVIVADGEGWDFLGDLIKSYQEVLTHVVEKQNITAKQVQGEMRYQSVNQASSILGALHQKRLIAREPYRRPVRGGGRQFRYLSLL